MMSSHFFYEPKNAFCLELLFLTMFPKGMRAIGKCRQTVRNKCKSKLAWAKLTKIRSFNGLSSSSNVGLTYTQISFAHYVIKTTKKHMATPPTPLQEQSLKCFANSAAQCCHPSNNPPPPTMHSHKALYTHSCKHKTQHIS